MPMDQYLESASGFWPPGAVSRCVSQRYGSEDPDPYQYVMDPQHWFYITFYFFYFEV